MYNMVTITIISLLINLKLSRGNKPHILRAFNTYQEVQFRNSEYYPQDRIIGTQENYDE